MTNRPAHSYMESMKISKEIVVKLVATRCVCVITEAVILVVNNRYIIRVLYKEIYIGLFMYI